MNQSAFLPLSFFLVALALFLQGCGGGSNGRSEAPVFTSKEALGESLFHDVNLSANRTQSCATCHNPDHAFVDNRTGADGQVRAVSLGDDGTSLGGRNAPTAAYAQLNPPFQQGSRVRFASEQGSYNGYLGGQFHDGRAATLAAQAGGPPLNPLEMGMPDKASVVDRIRDNADYVDAFERLLAVDIFADSNQAYNAMTQAIAAFESSAALASFDSQYDRWLEGDSALDSKFLFGKTARGKALFFSKTDTNCATCHLSKAPGSTREPFSGFEYHNIGVPVNTALAAAPADLGLGGALGESAQNGKFKVPTLRNVAVTGPYMHNGVFTDLQTVVKFYEHYHAGTTFSQNPETGGVWAAPEVAGTLAEDELADGDTLAEAQVTELVCFLRTLTDARYEHLLPNDGLCD